MIKKIFFNGFNGLKNEHDSCCEDSFAARAHPLTHTKISDKTACSFSAFVPSIKHHYDGIFNMLQINIICIYQSLKKKVKSNEPGI